MCKPKIPIQPKPAKVNPVHDNIPYPTPSSAVPSSAPQQMTMSPETIHRAVGFHNATKLIQNIHTLGNNTIHIQRLPKAEHIEPGEVASLSSQPRNTTPLKLPISYGDIWHMDIGFGPCASIGGIRYTLLLIDKRTKLKFVYGLKNLTSSLLNAMKQFINECGPAPKVIRTDFDSKLMGGDIQHFLREQKVRIESSPPYRQHQNGLVERHWQSMVSMARNWLTQSMLPVKYWFFAIKRAAEVMNMMPIKIDTLLTTPHEAAYQTKPDYRTLIPIFCLAYIRQHRSVIKESNKWSTKTLKCILVGQCPKSDGLLFYHPPSKQTLTCGDGYRFDTVTPAGPHFDENYEGDFHFNTRSSMALNHIKPTHEENATAFIQQNNQYLQVRIIDIPIDENKEVYTVLHEETGDIYQFFSHELLDHNPNADPIVVQNQQQPPFPHLPWLKDGAKATIYLPESMSQPKQGFIQQTDNDWSFIPGRTKKGEPISLPNFPLLVDSLILNKKLFKGWIAFSRVISARIAKATSNVITNLIVNKKVSAMNLHSKEAPTLLKHHQLHPEDQATWDEAYRQEYQGLEDIDT